MTVAIEPRKDHALVRIQGEMTIYSANADKQQLLAALMDYPGLTLDLAQTNELDSAGVQILLLLKQEAERANKALHLVNHSDPAIEVFELLHLSPLFGDPVLLRAERSST